MNLQKLSQNISKSNGVSATFASAIVHSVLDEITKAIHQKEDVCLGRSLGKLMIVVKRERIARNPKRPQDEYVIPAHNQVRFVPSECLRRKMLSLAPVEREKLPTGFRVSKLAVRQQPSGA